MPLIAAPPPRNGDAAQGTWYADVSAPPVADPPSTRPDAPEPVPTRPAPAAIARTVVVGALLAATALLVSATFVFLAAGVRLAVAGDVLLRFDGASAVLTSVALGIACAATLAAPFWPWPARRPLTLALAVVVNAAWPLSGVPLPAAAAAVVAVGLALARDHRVPGGRRATNWPLAGVLALGAAAAAIAGVALAEAFPQHSRSAAERAALGTSEPVAGGQSGAERDPQDSGEAPAGAERDPRDGEETPAGPGAERGAPSGGETPAGSGAGTDPHGSAEAPRGAETAPQDGAGTDAQGSTETPAGAGAETGPQEGAGTDAQGIAETPAQGETETPPAARTDTDTPARADTKTPAPSPTPAHGAPAPGEGDSPAPSAADAKAFVRAYYTALDEQRFDDAWAELSPAIHTQFGGFARWKAGYAKTVSSAPKDLAISRRGGATIVRLRLVARERDCAARAFSVTWTLERGSGEWSVVGLRGTALGGASCS